MLKTRYENYVHLDVDQAFVLHPRLQRTKNTHGNEMNWHENMELQLCLDGEGTVLLEGVTHAFRAGDVAVVGSNVLHGTYTADTLTYAALIVSTAFCRQMGINYDTYVFQPVVQDEGIRQMFMELIALYEDKAALLKAARQNLLLLQMLVKLGTHYTTPKEQLPTDKAPDTVKAAIRFIHEHYNEKLSLDYLAQNIYVNKFVLSRAFRRYTGKTVVEYINCYRCGQAAALITAGSRVSEAALNCGFDNLSFFTKTFKHHMGVLPSTLKKNI